MEQVRVGVIGIGNMGSHHARSFAAGKVPGAVLTAVCDTNPQRLEWAKANLGQDVQLFSSAAQLYEANCVDAVVIATPITITHLGHRRL